jgi:hypothetical protein
MTFPYGELKKVDLSDRTSPERGAVEGGSRLTAPVSTYGFGTPVKKDEIRYVGSAGYLRH